MCRRRGREGGGREGRKGRVSRQGGSEEEEGGGREGRREGFVFVQETSNSCVWERGRGRERSERKGPKEIRISHSQVEIEEGKRREDHSRLSKQTAR